MRRIARVAIAIELFLGLCVIAGGGASAAPVVTVVANVDGQPVGTSSQNGPVKLLPLQQSELFVTVTNDGPATIQIREVRLEGDVIGLTFFAYDTAVSMSIAPGETQSAHLALDLSGLSGQATGLIPGAVKVLDAHHHVLAQQNGVIDVRGSLRSVYGLFGLGVAFLTALSFLGALVGLARHRLPANRWRRGLRFLTPGLGLGLVVNFTLSAMRVFVPQLGRWATITLSCAIILFAIGYLTPTPDLEEDEEPSDEAVDEVAVLALAGRPGYAVLAQQPAQPQLSPDHHQRALAPPPTPDLDPASARASAQTSAIPVSHAEPVSPAAARISAETTALPEPVSPASARMSAETTALPDVVSPASARMSAATTALPELVSPASARMSAETTALPDVVTPASARMSAETTAIADPMTPAAARMSAETTAIPDPASARMSAETTALPILDPLLDSTPAPPEGTPEVSDGPPPARATLPSGFIPTPPTPAPEDPTSST